MVLAASCHCCLLVPSCPHVLYFLCTTMSPTCACAVPHISVVPSTATHIIYTLYTLHAIFEHFNIWPSFFWQFMFIQPTKNVKKVCRWFTSCYAMEYFLLGGWFTNQEGVLWEAMRDNLLIICLYERSEVMVWWSEWHVWAPAMSK